MRRFTLLVVSVISVGLSTSIQVQTGQNATLRCTYNTKQYNLLSACWCRGAFSWTGCYNQIIATDGRTVEPVSSKYQLLGPLQNGDVSLTILNVTQADAGLYGCRVEIPGWLNDKKHEVWLVVTAGKQTTTVIHPTSSSHHVKAGTSINVPRILVRVTVALVLLVTTCAIISIIARKLCRSRRTAAPSNIYQESN